MWSIFWLLGYSPRTSLILACLDQIFIWMYWQYLLDVDVYHIFVHRTASISLGAFLCWLYEVNYRPGNLDFKYLFWFHRSQIIVCFLAANIFFLFMYSPLASKSGMGAYKEMQLGLVPLPLKAGGAVVKWIDIWHIALQIHWVCMSEIWSCSLVWGWYESFLNICVWYTFSSPKLPLSAQNCM